MNAWLWIACAAPVSLLLAELVARVWIRTRRAYYPLKPHLRYLLEIDRETLPRMEEKVRFEVNADGERGGPPPAKGDQDTYRVLVAGGSAAECYFLDQPTSWPGALEARLATPERLARLGRRRIHVGNVARSLFGSRFLDQLFDKVLPRYPRLDLVIVMVGATDVVKWIGADCPATIDDRPATAAQLFMQHPEQPFGWSPRRWALRELAVRLRWTLLKPIEVRERAGKKVGEARDMRRHAKVMRTSHPDPAPMLDHFERYFRSLLRRAAATCRVLVVHQPCFHRPHTEEEERQFWGGGVGDPYHQVVTDYYSFEVIGNLMEQMNARAAAVADELGIQRVDLMPILERNLDTYYDFFHFTPVGSAKVAEVVAEAITR